MTAITTSSGSFAVSGVRRGDYLRFSGMVSGAVATSGFVRGTDVSGQRRVTKVGGSTLDARELHRHRLVEWLHAKAEDWVLWPWSDAKEWTAKRIRGVRP